MSLGALGGRFAALSTNAQGAVWMVGAAAVQMTNVTLIKLLALGGLDAFQIALGRAFFAFGALLPFLLRGGPRAFHTRYPFTHLWRALLGAAAMLLGFLAIAQLPLAVVTTYSFTTPLFAIVLAVFLLGEKVRWRRWAATGAGFCGVLVIARPGAETFDPYVLAALGSAFLIALAVILVKRFPPGESQVVMLFYFCVSSVIVALVPAIEVWRAPTASEWVLLVAVGFVGVGGHALVLKAYRTGETSFVVAFDYTKLIFAAAIGILLFSEWPDGWTLLGAAIIIASTLYIAQREARLARQARVMRDQSARPPGA